MVGIADLLDNPNVEDPAQREPFLMYNRSISEYNARIREEARKYATD